MTFTVIDHRGDLTEIDAHRCDYDWHRDLALFYDEGGAVVAVIPLTSVSLLARGEAVRRDP